MKASILLPSSSYIISMDVISVTVNPFESRDLFENHCVLHVQGHLKQNPLQ